MAFGIFLRLLWDTSKNLIELFSDILNFNLLTRDLLMATVSRWLSSLSHSGSSLMLQALMSSSIRLVHFATSWGIAVISTLYKPMRVIVSDLSERMRSR